MVDYVGYDGVQNQHFDSDNYWAEVSGPLFEMPYGTAFFAAGFEKRSSGFVTILQTALITAGSSSTNYREPTRGKTSVEEFFVEINIPLLEGVTGAQELELTVSARTSDYSAGGMVGATPNS